MSISILSITAQAPVGKVAAGLLGGDLPLSADGLPIDFAGLLGEQLGQLAQPALSGTLTLQGNQQTNRNDAELLTLADLSEEALPGLHTGQVPNLEMPLAANSGTLLDPKSIGVNGTEKGREKAIEHANQNARFLRNQASEPNANTPSLASTESRPQTAEEILAMIAPQKQEAQEKSKTNTEETLATIDPSSMAQTLSTYQNVPLENRRIIDVDRNKQPSFASLSDSPPAENLPLPPQSNLDSKSPGGGNPIPSLAQSIETPMANADAANLAAPSTSNGNSAPPAFASLMANHAQNASQAPIATSSPAIATALQDSRWPQEFSDRIVWIAKNDQQQAQINITPAQLGPVQITVNLNGDQASINFASPHAEVRKAIEDAMPNLREMLASSGINLGQSNVGAQLQQQQRELPRQFANGTRAAGENAILPADSRSGSTSSSLPIQRGRGLVDLFA